MTHHYGRESFPLERKDDGGGSSVADEVRREIKGFGDNIKGLKASMEKDLADVRKLAEEAKGGAEVKAQIAALTTSVGEKHAALDAAFAEQKSRADRLEAAMSRTDVSGGQDRREAVKEAMAFFDTKAAATGNLKWRDRPTEANVDMDGYKAWSAAFGSYLRAHDEREIEAKALSVGSNPDGGYLVPTSQSARIIQKVYETSPIRQLASVETIGGEALEIAIDTGDAGYEWEGETQAPSDTSTPTVGKQRIPVHIIAAKPKASQSLLDDAAVNVESWLAGKIADRFSRAEASAFVTGTGVNKPRGILTYAAGSAGARGTIKQVASGAATAITADAIVKMPLEVKSAYAANGVWLMKRSTVQAVMLLKDGQGQYLWRPGLQAGVPSALGGYPVMMADDMPVVGAGNLPIAFGDFRAGYTVVDRLGITTLRDPYSAKPFVEFYSRKRVGGDVTDFEAFALMVVSAS